MVYYGTPNLPEVACDDQMGPGRVWPRFGYEPRPGKAGLGFPGPWVAVQEPKLSYNIGEPYLAIFYTHCGNLI